MAKLTYKARKKLPSGAFALSGRRYPIEDKPHARNALARVSQHGTPEEKKEVRAKVHRKFPSIGGKRLGERKRTSRKAAMRRMARKRG